MDQSHHRNVDPPALRASTALLAAALLVTAWVPLVLIPLHHDIGWPLHVATRILSGERLYETIIEINPPLIFWFALLAQVSGSVLAIRPELVYHALGTAIVIAGVALTWSLLRLVLAGSSSYVRSALLLLFAFLAGPFAGYQFGQREHLMFATLVPYVLGAAAVAGGRRPSALPMFASGLLTAFGLAMKPFFIPIWIGTEAYMWRRCGAGALRRPQALGVLAGFLAYGVAALLFARDYLRVARWGMAAYGDFFPGALDRIIFSPQSGIALGALVLLALAPRMKELAPVRAIGALALITLTLAVYVQHKGWDYHWYPVLAMAWFLTGVTIAAMLRARAEGTAQSATAARPTPGSVTTAPAAASRVAYLLVSCGLLALGIVQSDRAVLRWGDLRGNPYFLREMLEVVAMYPPASRILPLSTTMQATVPLVNYAPLEHASRFATFWPLPAAYRGDAPSLEGPRYHQRAEMGEIEAYMFDSVLEDLARRPELLVVDQVPPAAQLFGFDWFAYLGQSARFRALISEYREIADVGGRYRVFALRRSPTAMSAASAPH
jgi:hypothetical protein